MRRRGLACVDPVAAVAAYYDARREVDRRFPDRNDPARPAALARLLSRDGLDAIACIRARRALRRGERWTP